MGQLLMLEDDAALRVSLRSFLERQGHTVEEVATGEALLSRLARGFPDLVFLDMQTATMDGLQVLQKVRELNKNLPVMMVSGYTSKDSSIDPIQKGATLFISKPFKNEELFPSMLRLGLKPGIVASPPSIFESPATPSPAMRTAPGLNESAYPPERISKGSRFSDGLSDAWFRLSQGFFAFMEMIRAFITGHSHNKISSSVSMEQLSYEMKQSVERIHQDLTAQIRTMTESMQSEIDRLGEKVSAPAPAPLVTLPENVRDQLRADMIRAVDGIHRSMNARLDTLTRSLQEQFRTMAEQKALPAPVSDAQRQEWDSLLSSVRSTLDQGLSSIGKDISLEKDALVDWRKQLSDLRRSTESPSSDEDKEPKKGSGSFRVL